MATVAVLVGLTAPALARGKASLSINEPNIYELGEQITFTGVNYRTSTPWVQVQCYQDGERVYYQALGIWDGAMGGGVFTLGPSRNWTEGDADCMAKLGTFHNGRFKTEAKMNFHVYGY